MASDMTKEVNTLHSQMKLFSQVSSDLTTADMKNQKLKHEIEGLKKKIAELKKKNDELQSQADLANTKVENI